MTVKLSKRPIMFVFWLVLASGVAVVLGEQAGFPPGGMLALVSRTVFWCAAIAYFVMRLYQFGTRPTGLRTKEPDSADGQDN